MGLGDKRWLFFFKERRLVLDACMEQDLSCESVSLGLPVLSLSPSFLLHVCYVFDSLLLFSPSLLFFFSLSHSLSSAPFSQYRSLFLFLPLLFRWLPFHAAVSYDGTKV